MAEHFVALVIYPTTPDAQSHQADRWLDFATQKVGTLPGFLGGRVLLSEDGESLVTLTEWRDRESFQRFRESEFGRAAVLLAAELHPKSYWLRLHRTVGAS